MLVLLVLIHLQNQKKRSCIEDHHHHQRIDFIDDSLCSRGNLAKIISTESVASKEGTVVSGKKRLRVIIGYMIIMLSPKLLIMRMLPLKNALF
jgi:hypothetical protein